MKGQRLDEAKAGVNDVNFGGIPYQEAEYYEYRNWLETYLLNNPNESGLSENELLAKFRQLHPNAAISSKENNAIQGDAFQGEADLDTEFL